MEEKRNQREGKEEEERQKEKVRKQEIKGGVKWGYYNKRDLD